MIHAEDVLEFDEKGYIYDMSALGVHRESVARCADTGKALITEGIFDSAILHRIRLYMEC